MTALQSGTWLTICPFERLTPNRGVAALLPGNEPIAVFRTNEDALFAVSNVDPFSGASVLSRGIVGDRGGVPVVVSPVYKQGFDLRTGICLEDPSVSITTYPVRLDDGMVSVNSP
jgi:nitrite reductase (NADH) small subunit